MSNYKNLTTESFLALVKELEIEWIDVRFTDPRGKWHHLSMCADVVDEDMIEEGHPVLVRWHYDDDDEDMQEAGEEYADMVDVPFEMVMSS